MIPLNFSPTDWLLWPGLFIGYFILDLLNTKNVITIQDLRPLPTANISLATTVLATIGTYICVKDSLWNLVPIGLGVWFGSYFALRWEIAIKRRNMAKTINVGVGKYRVKPKAKRRGVVAKTKQSSNKASKNYVKPYVGQGKK